MVEGGEGAEADTVAIATAPTSDAMEDFDFDAFELWLGRWWTSSDRRGVVRLAIIREVVRCMVLAETLSKVKMGSIRIGIIGECNFE